MSCQPCFWPPNWTSFGSFWIQFTGKVLFFFKVDTNMAMLHITAQTAFPWLFKFLLAQKECVKSYTSWAMCANIVCAMGYLRSSVVEPSTIHIIWSIIASFGLGNSVFFFFFKGMLNFVLQQGNTLDCTVLKTTLKWLLNVIFVNLPFEFVTENLVDQVESNCFWEANVEN